MSTLRITPRDETSKFYVIELDGVNISQYVNCIRIVMSAGEMPLVTLKLVPLEIDIPPEIELTITEAVRESALKEVTA